MSEISKIVIERSSVGEKKGWAFQVFWTDRPYPNFISALYKTKRETVLQVDRYLKDKSFDYYGSAEK
jgi:hypothetical protein